MSGACGPDALLTGLFDYAGLFPPASLPFEAMLREAASFPRTLRRPALVGSELVLRWSELERVAGERLAPFGFERGRRLRICALGAPLGPAAWDGWRDAAEALLRFHAREAGSSLPKAVVTLELPLAPGAEPARALGTLAEARDALAEGGIRLFVEPAWAGGDWERLGPALWEALDILNAPGQSKAGLKLRCAGPTALGPAALARVLSSAVPRGLPIKLTQGLHRPLADPACGSALGFLGAAVAVRLLGALGPEEFPEDAVAACLACPDARAFDFSGGAAWQDFRAGAPAPAAAIAAAPLCVGSCSLREPDDGLAALFGPGARRTDELS